MKFILTFIFCSGLANQCLPPILLLGRRKPLAGRLPVVVGAALRALRQPGGHRHRRLRVPLQVLAAPYLSELRAAGSLGAELRPDAALRACGTAVVAAEAAGAGDGDPVPVPGS